MHTLWLISLMFLTTCSATYEVVQPLLKLRLKRANEPFPNFNNQPLYYQGQVIQNPFNGGQPALRAVQLPCSCEGSRCACCATINLPQFNFNQRGCINATYEDFALNIDLLLNGASFYNYQLSAMNPPPICVPVPQLPIVMICTRFYDLKFHAGDGVKACVNLEVRVARITVLIFQFDCFRISPSGFDLEKPSVNPNKPAVQVVPVYPDMGSIPSVPIIEVETTVIN